MRKASQVSQMTKAHCLNCPKLRWDTLFHWLISIFVKSYNLHDKNVQNKETQWNQLSQVSQTSQMNYSNQSGTVSQMTVPNHIYYVYVWLVWDSSYWTHPSYVSWDTELGQWAKYRHLLPIPPPPPPRSRFFLPSRSGEGSK